MDCKREINQQSCTCAAVTCGSRGLCCECLANHLAGQSLPACCFPGGKADFGRSFKGFAKSHGLIPADA
jgi:hypothetical protein